ncbi:MAG: hypothetical protein QXX08_04220 [Candidatus Bathyarchaeia archaeon]
MPNLDDALMKIKYLEKQKHMLIEEMKNLEENHKKKKVNEDIYKERRHDIEKALVEIMDHLVQMNFLKRQK